LAAHDKTAKTLRLDGSGRFMDQDLEDLIEACKAAGGSAGLLRALLRQAKESPHPSGAITYLSSVAGVSRADTQLHRDIARFLQLHEHSEAALAWVAGEDPVLKVERARILFALGRKPEAVACYRDAVRADPSLRDDELDKHLSVVQAVSSGGAEVIDLTSRRVTRPEERTDLYAYAPTEHITFASIGGLDDVKDQIRRKIILPFQKPSLYQKFRRKSGGGILLYGPPGCGKTMLARATAGECNAKFISIRIPDILDMYIGESEKRLAGAFASARADKPVVLFFDEVEAIAARRRFESNSSQASLVSTFLAELDGLDASNEGVLILAATNVPWAIDAAFRRPGRFDRVLFVPPPDEPARQEILRSHLQERPQVAALDLKAIAARTSGFSGADLAGLIEEATDMAIDESLAGDGSIAPISQSHLTQALRTRRSTTIEWLTTARNYAKYSNEGGLYDDVVDFLRKHTK
jgi:transitional endoplasmic reticulum ATPase